MVAGSVETVDMHCRSIFRPTFVSLFTVVPLSLLPVAPCSPLLRLHAKHMRTQHTHYRVVDTAGSGTHRSPPDVSVSNASSKV